MTQILAVIRLTKKDITLAFSRGAEMDDKYNLLQGVVKVSKPIKLKEQDNIHLDVLRYYIQQALDLDAA